MFSFRGKPHPPLYLQKRNEQYNNFLSGLALTPLVEGSVYFLILLKEPLKRTEILWLPFLRNGLKRTVSPMN